MNTNLKSLFRRLLAAEALMVTAFYVSDVLLINELPPEHLRYIERLAEQEPLNVFANAFFILLLVGYAGSVVMLWWFSRTGRFLYTALLIVSIITNVGLEPQVYHQFTSLFGGIAAVFSGMIVALMYFSELREEFLSDDGDETNGVQV